MTLGLHPYIVHCHMMELLDGQPFALLDWIVGEEGRGTDLRGWLHSGPLNVKLASEVALDICRGLRYAEKKQPGIVHRDLKPENILMAQGPVAKITDWGLARVVQQIDREIQGANYQVGIRHSSWGNEGIAGTPAYMAPEQWQAGPIDLRADIYALGCILYEMITGDQPYRASTPAGYRRQHLKAPIPLLVLEDMASEELDKVITRCLAKTPNRRYQTIDDLLQTLEAIYRWRFSAEPQKLNEKEKMTARDLINRGVTYSLLEDFDNALVDLDHALSLGQE